MSVAFRRAGFGERLEEVLEERYLRTASPWGSVAAGLEVDLSPSLP